MERDAQRMQDTMRREQMQREAQRLEDTMRREQEQRRAQHMQYEMARVQAREQQDHRQRIVQLEAQRIQNETRHLQTEKLLLREKRMNVCHRKLNSLEGSKRLKQMLFTGKQEERDRLEAAAYDQACAAEMLPELHRRLLKLLHKHKLSCCTSTS